MLFAWLFGLEKTFYPDPEMYNCSGTSLTPTPSPGIGLLYLGLGLFYQACYIPCIIVMSRPPLWNMPCFKIMVYLGIVDVCCLFICGDAAGLWSILGTRFCAAPHVSFVLGSFSMGFWSATCMCCVFLAFNRTCDLCIPSMTRLFEGRAIYFWLALPTVYFVFFTFFERPLIYEPAQCTFFFDPHTAHSLRMPEQQALQTYANLPHSLNNLAVIVCLSCFYIIICANLAYKAHYSRIKNLSAMTRQIMVQSLIICGCHIIGCFLYVFMQYVPLPPVFTIISNLAWMGNHGLPGVVYLSLNNTIRQRVINIFIGSNETTRISRNAPVMMLTEAGFPMTCFYSEPREINTA